MDYNSKHSFSLAENAMISIVKPLNDLSYWCESQNNTSAKVTLLQLLQFANINCSELSEEVKREFDRNISGVCRAGSRFTKDCITVQLYEDADEMITWAYRHGAVVCITRKNVCGVPCIVVEEPELLYAKLCLYFRIKRKIHTVAIAGSIGKTTTKQMIKCVCNTNYNVFCDEGNDNQLDGVGYISQHIPKNADLWIQETSEDTPGCMEAISMVVRPNIIVITSIDKSHIESFTSEGAICSEVKDIAKYCEADTKVITNIDDELNSNLCFENNEIVSVSLKNCNADYYAGNISINSNGITFSIIVKGDSSKHTVVINNAFAKHNVYSALYAFAVGDLSNINRDKIIEGISHYMPTGIRQNLFKANDILVYADCYNAVAKSISSAVNTCDLIPVSGKRVAVIGDIAETGSYSDSVHSEIVNILYNSKFDYVFTCGRSLSKALMRSKKPNNVKCYIFNSQKEMNSCLKTELNKGDLVLLKGSHSSHLEKTIKHLFPVKYYQIISKYYFPQLIWRFKVISSWT